jgi:hypothetical protein
MPHVESSEGCKRTVRSQSARRRRLVSRNDLRNLARPDFGGSLGMKRARRGNARTRASRSRTKAEYRLSVRMDVPWLVTISVYGVELGERQPPGR